MKPTNVRSKWEVAEYAGLPGATTTVEIDLSSLTPRMRTNLIKKMEEFLSGQEKSRGWYSKSNKLFRIAKKYCGIHEFHVSPWGIDIPDITPEIWDFAYGIYSADTSVLLMSDSASQHRKERRRLQSVEVRSQCGDPNRNTFKVGLDRGEDFEEPLAELRSMVVTHYKKQETEKFEKLQQLIYYGGTIQLQLTRGN